MSLDKAVKHGKERRKPHTGGKLIANSCRNHGGCPWCEGNRLHKHKRREPIPDDHIIDPEEPHLMRLFFACYSPACLRVKVGRSPFTLTLTRFLKVNYCKGCNMVAPH
ncbi:MAG: hypothetical protein L3K52_15305 [Candidatus Thiothrix sulfatifontis]|nr:MAG: hypothetical protein L3K52_15305 [Candidatus Thiothrix sulfatifontis]